jgi:hypothetical protein
MAIDREFIVCFPADEEVERLSQKELDPAVIGRMGASLLPIFILVDVDVLSRHLSSLQNRH